MSVTRRSLLATAAPTFASAAAMAASPSAASRADAATDQDVADVVRRATQAHEALMRGDMRRYRSLLSYTDDFTLMSPFGGKPTHAAQLTDERMEEIGRFFKNGRESTLDVVQAYRSADMIVLAVIERTHVAVGDIPEQDWALRVTLVFRKEQGQWILAHRHADPLVDAISVKQSAVLARGSSAR